MARASVKGKGTRKEPWTLKTPPGSSEFSAFRDEALDPPALVVQVGKNNMDSAGEKYWSKLWGELPLPKIVNPKEPGLINYINRRWHKFFCEVFGMRRTKDEQLLEVGCARSIWLPYYAKEFGFKISGIDYSETGCAQESLLLSSEGVNGRIVCSDFFSPPDDMIGAFDVVVSFGVMEHFKNTSDCAEMFARFLKPEGLLITIIPNMIGLIGMFQKVLNRPVYEIHVPLTKEALAAAHKNAGLKVLSAGYFLSTNFGVVNLSQLPINLTYLFKKVLLASLTRVSMGAWFFEEKCFLLPEGKTFSPYIFCTAQKKRA